MAQQKLQKSPGNKKNPPLKAINIIDYKPEDDEDLEVLPMTGSNLQILDK